MFVRIGLRGVVFVAALGVAFSAAAQEQMWSNWSEWSGPGYQQDQGAVRFSGGVGIVTLQANEYVLAGDNFEDLVSRLIWQSTAPMATGAIEVKLPEGWTLKGSARVALGGESYMEDYDWFGPNFISYDEGDWTHRSQHDDTNLDWYFGGTLLIGYDMPASDGMRINVNGGFKYTDVQWAARGGSYVYSDDETGDGCGFRGCVGDFPDGEAGITYRQTLPALVAGIDTEFTDGAWTLGAAGHVGVTFNGRGDDYHWMRDINFVDSLEPAPMVSAELSASYEVMDEMNLFVSGSAEQVFMARGDTKAYDIPTGEDLASYPDSASGDLFAASLSAGIKGSF